MVLRFDDIGNRLRAFRLGSGLSADEVAKSLRISRTALYRFEKGDVVKIETLDRLSELLGVSITTLLGLGVEFVSSAITYFERLRQLEERAEHIVILAGPISYLLASSSFDSVLVDVLRESVPATAEDRTLSLNAIDEIMTVLRMRKESYQKRRPNIVNLISGVEMEGFVRDGLLGRRDLPRHIIEERRTKARSEAQHLMQMMMSEPIGVQIGIVLDTLPHSGFQLFKQSDRKVLTLSPFRLGSQPNVRTGIAMVTSAPEALDLHEKMTEDLWKRAIKGPAAANLIQKMIDTIGS